MSRRLECDRVLENLESYLDGDLGAGAPAVEKHLATCSECRAELDLAARIRSELRSWPELDAPPRVLRAVFEKVGEERFGGRPARRSRSGSRRPAWAALAAAVFAAAVLGSGVYWTVRDPAPQETVASSTAPEPAGVSVEDLDPEEIARATEEARLALATFARVSRRTSLKVRDEVLVDRLVRPSAGTLTRVLQPLGVLAPRETDERDRS